MLVYDRFHVVKLFNEKLSDLRRELHREAADQLDKQVLKGTRWLLLKNPENLDDAKGEHRRLEEALELNESLAKAYYLKEDLRPILGAVRPTGGRSVPHALASQSGSVGNPHAQRVRQDTRFPSARAAGLVHLPHQHRSPRRDQ